MTTGEARGLSRVTRQQVEERLEAFLVERELGWQLPQHRTELLAQAVNWTRFPPMGVRGYGLGGPHLSYERITIGDAITHLNEHVMVVLQVETRLALQRLDDLLAVPNIDAVLVGPADLSVALGVPGQFDHPDFIAAVELVRDRCNAYGIAPGMHMRSIDMARFWIPRGLRFVSCNNDIGMLFERVTETVSAMHAAKPA